MRLNAVGEVRSTLTNGPCPKSDSSLPDSKSLPFPHHTQVPLSNAPNATQPTFRTPCTLQSMANGPVSASPSPCSTAGALANTERSSVGNNHLPGQGSNGNVPYLQQNALPRNCATPTSSSSTMNDQLWKSQHVNSTQVTDQSFTFFYICGQERFCNFFLIAEILFCHLFHKATGM